MYLCNIHVHVLFSYTKVLVLQVCACTCDIYMYMCAVVALRRDKNLYQLINDGNDVDICCVSSSVLHVRTCTCTCTVHICTCTASIHCMSIKSLHTVTVITLVLMSV